MSASGTVTRATRNEYDGATTASNWLAKTLNFRRKGGRTNDNPISRISHIDRWCAVSIAPLLSTAELSLIRNGFGDCRLEGPVEFRAIDQNE